MRFRRLDTGTLLAAYARGVFPMAESRESDAIYWIDPDRRGVLPMGAFRAARSLRRRLRAQPFEVTFDRDFPGVLEGCADRDETWINPGIRALYLALYAEGHGHSVELWEGDALVGGVYGVSLGAAFFGESMFSRRRDASKVALAYLMDRLMVGGYTLFDTQFLTPHLASLGGLEIPRAEYHDRLTAALRRSARFDAARPVPPPDQVLQRIAQTS